MTGSTLSQSIYQSRTPLLMEAKSKSERKAERFSGYPARSETLRRTQSFARGSLRLCGFLLARVVCFVEWNLSTRVVTKYVRARLIFTCEVKGPTLCKFSMILLAQRSRKYSKIA